MPRLNRLVVIEDSPMTIELRYSEFSGHLGECLMRLKFAGTTSIDIVLTDDTFLRTVTLSSFPILKVDPFTAAPIGGTVNRIEAIREVRRLIASTDPKGADHG